MKKQTEEVILSIIKEHGAALTSNSILEKLDFKIGNSRLKKALDSLKHEGKIVTTKKGRIISIENSGRIVAEIISHSKNFSFAKSLYGNEEIFISKSDLKSAMIGDRVIIGRIKNSEKGLSGAVEKIIEQGKHILTGKVMCNLYGLEVACDLFVRYNIPISRGYAAGAKVGDKVKIILTREPKSQRLYAKVIKIYGKSDSAKVCADAVIDSNGIPVEFSKGAIEQSRSMSSTPISEKELASRLDLRNEIIFTIDGEYAKDLDDAISIKRLQGGWELGVHIADVSHYVKMGTELDKEAFTRGTSVYFANKVIPMLPETLSNGACSLNPGEDKLTFSAIVKLDENGGIIDYKFAKSVINSKVRGVYSEINEILSGEPGILINNKYKSVMEYIFLSKELSDILTASAKKRGVLDISSTESEFILDRNGKCIDIKPRVQGESERIIENFMISANSAAALYAKNHNLPFVYRVHEEPNPAKIENLAKLAGALGLKGSKIRPGIKPAELSELLQQAENTSSKKVLSRQILQTMDKARYDSKPLGHFGLSLKDYCHFTSPIRRYPDICVHRILSDAISKKSNSKYNDLVQDYSRESTLCEIRSMKAEREAEKYYMAEFMSQHVGEFYSGVISSATPKGVFIELENSVSGFMDLSYYDRCRFIFDGIANHVDAISGKRLSVGDKIKVKVVSANISSAMIDFAPT